MKIGYVTDYFGKTIYEAHAPAAGVVLYICGVPSMKKGDTVANIGEITTNPNLCRFAPNRLSISLFTIGLLPLLFAARRPRASRLLKIRYLCRFAPKSESQSHSPARFAFQRWIK